VLQRLGEKLGWLKLAVWKYVEDEKRPSENLVLTPVLAL
jgi:hypothetical protein